MANTITYVLSVDNKGAITAIKQVDQESKRLDSTFVQTGSSSVSFANTLGNDVVVNAERGGAAVGQLGTRTLILADIMGSAIKKIASELVGFATDVVGVGAEFEQKMARVRAISGANAQEFEALSRTAREMGASTRFSASQAAEALSFLAMAGYDTKSSIEALPGVLNLASAAGADLGTSADIVSNVLSGFGLDATETARLTDVLTATFTSSNTSLAMLGDTMKYVAPLAAALNIPIEDVAAMAGKLGDAGIQSSQAGTAMRSMLASLVRPSSEAKKVMDELGISVSDAEGNMKSMPDLISHISTQTASLTDVQRTQILGQLVGTEAISAFSVLLAQGGDNLRAYSDELSNSAGRAQELATIQNDTLQGAFDELGSASEELKLQLFELFGEELKSMLRGFGDGLRDSTDDIAAFLEFLIVNGKVSVDAVLASFRFLEDNGAKIFINLITAAKNYFVNLPEIGRLGVVGVMDQVDIMRRAIIDSFVNMLNASKELGSAIYAAILDPFNAEEKIKQAFANIAVNAATQKDIWIKLGQESADNFKSGFSKVKEIIGQDMLELDTSAFDNIEFQSFNQVSQNRAERNQSMELPTDVGGKSVDQQLMDIEMLADAKSEAHVREIGEMQSLAELKKALSEERMLYEQATTDEARKASQARIDALNKEIAFKTGATEREKALEQQRRQAMLQSQMMHSATASANEKSIAGASKAVANGVRTTIRAHIAEAAAAVAKKMFSSVPFPVSLAVAPAAAAAAQVAFNNLIPAFQTGGLVEGEEKLIRVNEKGPEFIVNAESTRNNLELLEFINTNPSVDFSVVHDSGQKTVAIDSNQQIPGFQDGGLSGTLTSVNVRNNTLAQPTQDNTATLFAAFLDRIENLEIKIKGVVDGLDLNFINYETDQLIDRTTLVWDR